MEITIATPRDIPRLCELLEALFTQESEFTPNLEAQSKGLSHIIDEPRSGEILVARKDDEVVGMLNLLYTVSTALGERVVLLEDMVVSKDVRGQGVGSQLLDYAIDYAREQGFKRITLLTDEVNKEAHRFYAKHGFTRSNMVPFCLYLEDGKKEKGNVSVQDRE